MDAFGEGACELEVGLGALNPDQVGVRRVGEPSGDDRLDQVLAEIDLRVAVELAKAGMS